MSACMGTHSLSDWIYAGSQQQQPKLDAPAMLERPERADTAQSHATCWGSGFRVVALNAKQRTRPPELHVALDLQLLQEPNTCA